MKTPNLNHLIQQQQRNQRLKTIANKLANQLILDFDINDDYQMAYFLNLGQSLDNYSAIRKWAGKWLKTHYSVFDSLDTLNDLQHDDTLYSELKEQFLNYFPQTATA